MDDRHDVTTPLSNKAPVWKYFGFHKDENTGKLLIKNQAVCKLCLSKVAQSGGTTNLPNHLRSHHCEEYNSVFGDTGKDK